MFRKAAPKDVTLELNLEINRNSWQGVGYGQQVIFAG